MFCGTYACRERLISKQAAGQSYDSVPALLVRSQPQKPGISQILPAPGEEGGAADGNGIHNVVPVGRDREDIAGFFLTLNHGEEP